MRLGDKNILVFTRTMGLGGTENVVLMLCEILKPVVKKVVVCSCGGLNTEKLDRMGIVHYAIPDIENKSIKTIRTVSKILKKIVKEEKIDIIHTHHRMAAFYVSVLKLYKRCILVSTAHNTFKDKKFLTRYAYKHSNMIACGEMVKRNLVEHYRLNKEQVTTIHNAVKEFGQNITIDPILRSSQEEGYTLVGNIGRLSEQKGMKYFIEAIPTVLNKCPQTKFFIVGSGEKESELKELANKLNIGKSLIFMGYRPDIQNVMSQLDFIVLSSLWEGLPLTPIEAFSVKKTIVATAVDGTVEVVKDGENGLLIPPRDPETLACKIIELCQNLEFRRKLEYNAFEAYCVEFSFEHYSDRIQELYRNL